MSELKACPFCGSDASGPYDRQSTFYTDWYVGCVSCSCSVVNKESPEEAVTAWNSRQIEDALQARIEELEKMLNGAYERLMDDPTKGDRRYCQDTIKPSLKEKP